MGGIGNMFGPGLGGVQHLIGEGALQLGQAYLQLAVALLLLGRQGDAGQFEVTQSVFKDGLLGGVQLGKFVAVGQLLIGVEQRLILPHLGVVLTQQRQAALVGFAQLWAVHHRVEVADWRPGAAKALAHVILRLDQVGPGPLRRRIGQQRIELCAVVGQNLLDGRFDVLGADLGKGWQIVGLQQRIGHGGYPDSIDDLQCVHGNQLGRAWHRDCVRNSQ